MADNKPLDVSSITAPDAPPTNDAPPTDSAPRVVASKTASPKAVPKAVPKTVPATATSGANQNEPAPRSRSRAAISPRLLTALFGIPLVVLVVWQGGAWLVAVTILLALIAMRELVVAARRNRTPLVIELAYPLMLLALFALLRIGAKLLPSPVGTAASASARARPAFFSLFSAFSLFAAAIALLAFAIWRYNKPKPVTLISVALTVLSILYVSLLGFLPLVRGIKSGEYLIWVVLFGVWSGDTAAYYAGRAWGRHKLTPLSPGKSREGLWASVMTTIAVCAGLAGAMEPIGWIHGLALGVLIAGFAPLGDLAESFWKRELNVKDLGSILPGHGGVLDRCDSLMFAAPAAYIYALWQAL